MFGRTVDDIAYKILRNKDFKEVTLQVQLISRIGYDREQFNKILIYRAVAVTFKFHNNVTLVKAFLS